MSNKVIHFSWVLLIWVPIVRFVESTCEAASLCKDVRPRASQTDEHCFTLPGSLVKHCLEWQSFLQTFAAPLRSHEGVPSSVMEAAPEKAGHKVSSYGSFMKVVVTLTLCVILFATIVVAVLIVRYREFLEEDTEDTSPTRLQACAREDPPHDNLEGSGPRKGIGTASRMTKLPPTALASIGPDLLRSPSSEPVGDPKTESPQLPSTTCMSSASTMGSISLPPLIPGFESSRYEEACTWTIPYQLCQARVVGIPIEVCGSPPLYARLAKSGHDYSIELGRRQHLDASEATIGPLNCHSSPGLAANIIGPDGQLYGYFMQDGIGFAVKHKSQSGNAITLEPVMTSKGSFLEIAADGHPICLARLTNPNGHGVEIDADPDVDSFLIVSCVLACLVARPGLLGDIPLGSSSFSSSAPTPVVNF